MHSHTQLLKLRRSVQSEMKEQNEMKNANANVPSAFTHSLTLHSVFLLFFFFVLF